MPLTNSTVSDSSSACDRSDLLFKPGLNVDLKILENIPLAPLTTLGVGGAARYFVKANTEAEVESAIGFATANSLPLFVLGGGSNVLIADTGFKGLVLQIGIKGRREIDTEDSGMVCVEAAAGEDWDETVAWCVERDLAGIECLSGIPGLVGGTPVQNVGAYGQEVSETIREVRCFDRRAHSFVTLSNADCEFSYRKSIFNSTDRDRYVVLGVVFELKRSGEPQIVYRDLVEYFAGTSPSIADTREAVLSIRRAKSMVIDADDPNCKSAGSFFKNPTIEKARFDNLAIDFPGIPNFDAGDLVKIPAAWLIENAGFTKGYSLGNAGISSRHTLALINRGGASAGEILVLKEKIRDAVAKKFGIDLIPEPVFVGF